MSNVAQEVIIPQKSGTFRTVFLYVGQGEATLMAIPDGDSFKYVLIDSNVDKENEGLDL
jgi:competence protein ComEC